uniref:Uncharacterized protein n=1 Tax=Neogobius melanostomus TaxID=47308 RepID=A0A8C6T8F3_9GOBI
MLLEYFQLDTQAFSCSICLDFLKEPTTLPCGHNYCRSCIQSYWDKRDESSCPQCRQRFSPRPVLVTNTMLAELVEHVQRIELFVHSEVSREIRALQEKEEAQLKQLHDQLQRDIALLRITVSELDSLTPGRALQHYPPLSALDPPRTYALSLGSLEQAASAVTALTDLLKVTLKDGLQNISQGFRTDQHPPPRPETALSLPEPKTREEFINYAREIVLDPNTAHQKLKLSRGNRRVTNDSYGAHSVHPDRFRYFYQVLSRDGLTGRCYWEVEWEDFDVIAVSYKNIKRKGDSEKSEFGFNDKSWALQGKPHCSSFWHHRVETELSGPVSGRIGVYLDHSAGVLAFYSICNSKINRLIHRVQTTFTQPLYAGVRFFNTHPSVAAYFPKLK